PGHYYRHFAPLLKHLIPNLGSSWNFGMAATVLAMSVESSVLEQAWNCLNADEAGQRAIVIPRSVATRDLLFVGRDEQERARAARATPNRTGSASSVSEKQIPRFARDDIFVALCPPWGRRAPALIISVTFH